MTKQNPNALVSSPEKDNREWHEIVDSLIQELQPDDLPDKVVQATEMLLAGYPVHKVALALKVETSTVRRWLSTYPTMSAVIANGKKLLIKWRMAKLEQQFFTAVERSREVLEVPFSGLDNSDNRVDPKILTVVAAQARYIIGLFAAQKSDVVVTHELGETVLKAKTDALSYIAEQLAVQQANAADQPIEVSFRVIDAKSEASGPLLDENGNPPFGKMGEVDRNEEGALCHVCGRRFAYLSNHALTAHNMPTGDYEDIYMLGPGSLKQAERS